MSVLHCTVKVVKPGTMKNGNPYQRLCLEKPDGTDEWMPNFTGKMVNVGDKLIAEIKEGRYSEEYGQQYLIDDFVIDGGASAKESTQRPAESNSGGSSSPDADTWRKKDLVISTQAIFKTIAPLPTKNNMTYSETLVSCFKLACELEKRVNAYVAGADIDGMKRNLADEVQAAVNEQGSYAGNTDVAGPEHTSQPDDPGFDDDIPF